MTLRKRGSRRRVVNRKSKRDAEVKELDRLAREVVMKRDGGKCRRCGSERRLQWCHIYSRRYPSLRWDPDNALCLCAGCHLWQHHNPLDSSAWVEQAIGPATAARLRTIMKTARRGIDRAAWKLWLTAQLERRF